MIISFRYLKYYLPFYKTSYPNEEVNRTESSPSVRVPCLVPHSQNFHFFVIYKWSQKAGVFVRGKPYQLSLCNTLAYWAVSKLRRK